MTGDKRLSGDAVFATVSYESGVAATVDFRKGPAVGRPGAPIRGLEDPAVLHGRMFGDFVLGEVLGQGGCGIVYRAEQRSLGRPAVIKVVHRSPTARSDLAERFVREARLASRFDHPYAAHVYAFGVEDDGLMWIAMELVDGTPLGRLVRESGPLALDQFVPLFERLCDVVQSAHDQGIIHRDIKPSNVMVIARAGRLMPKLLDFGIAKRVPGSDGEDSWIEVAPTLAAASPAGTDPTLTVDGQVLGSPAYMAPEQWRDAATAGPLADQYALAVLAYEALTGQHAFTGRSIEELAEQHLNAPLPALPDHLPAALDAVLARASDKAPERRFANLSELTAAVRLAAREAPGEHEAWARPAADGVVPYPGLAPYTAAEHALFVGRERDIEDALDQLDRHAIVTVVGPSGSGKTSFLAAGLAPSFEPSWQPELLRPGSDPLGALAAIAERQDGPPDREGSRSDGAMPPAAIAKAFVGIAQARGGTLVVLVDQAEELFTMCADDAQRAGFAEALVLAAASGCVRVVLALRDDFLWRVEQLPTWRGRLGRAIHVLGPPQPEDLERMLTVPARRRGFRFDDPDLPREIVQQVAGRPGALPLVAFTAAKLWERRDRGARQLTRAAYDEIGGVTGALVQHADSVVDRMSVPDRRQVRLVFRRLITAEGTRALISRAELEGALEAASAAAVIDRLLAARLVVSRDDDAGDRIEIIHETLATTWPRLAAWRAQDADGVRLQEQLAVAARHWDERGRPADLTWRGDALADLRRWQDRGDHRMTPVEQAFARASVAAASRVRHRRIALVALSFALLVAGIVGLVSANREIARQRTAAVERLSTSLEERGRAAIAEGDHARAMLVLAEARRFGAGGPGLALLTSHATRSLGGDLQILGHFKVGIYGLSVGPTSMVTIGSDLALTQWDRAGGKTHLADEMNYAILAGGLTLALSAHRDVIAFDGSGKPRWRIERAVAEAPLYGLAASEPGQVAIAWSKNLALIDLTTGRVRGTLPQDSDITAAALDAAGTQVATGDAAGVVRIWDAATLTMIARCEPHAGIVRAIKLAPEARAISAGNEGEVRICDAATGATLHRLIGHSHQAYLLDVTRDGHLIVSAGRDGKPRLWDARTGLLIRVLEGHRGSVLGVQISPDGSRVLTLGLDGTARIWDVEGTALGSLQGHGGPIFVGRWDTDGRHIITTSMDGAIRSWDPGRATAIRTTHAHRDAITGLAVSRDDRWVATASADGTAALWDRRTLEPIARLDHGSRVRSIAFAPDGTRALTTDDAGRARIWKVPEGTTLEVVADVTAATFDGDGRVITAGNGTVSFRGAPGARLDDRAEVPTVALDYRAEQLILDPSGRWLFVRGETSSVLVIDVAARAQAARLAVGDPRVRGLAVDGTQVAITADTAIQRWQLASWTPLGALRGHKSAVLALWSGAGGKLVSATLDTTTLVWSSGQPTRLPDPNRVFAVATSSDGSLLATSGTDGEIRIWDAVRDHLLLQLPAHRLPTTALAFTHDGMAVISAGNDGRLATWDLTRRERSAAELAEIVRCRVPLRLEGDAAVPRDLDFDDPACKALVVDR